MARITSKSRFSISGEGLPGLRGSHRGDLVVEMELKTPTGLIPRQEELLKEFLQQEGD